jgi:hypothetical protein
MCSKFNTPNNSVLLPSGQRLFPEGLKGNSLWNQMAYLVSHWPLAMETSG